MNVIWKEKKCRKKGGGAEIEIVFTPSDVVKNLEDTIVIGISVTSLTKKNRQKN